MPYNPYALIRYRVIDRCLQQRGQRWTSRELSEACGETIREQGRGDEPDPSERTIKKDIADMRSSKLGYEAPLEWDARNRTYRYTDPNYSITNSPLGQEDLKELRHALVILRQFQGFEQVAGIEEMVARLSQALRYGQPAPDPRTLVQLEYNDKLRGLYWIGPLFRAIDKRQCLLIEYQPFYEAAPQRRIVSPYLLKEYNSRWFLVGWEHRKQKIYTHPLDRIQRAELYLLEDFYEQPGYDPERRYRHVVGVTLPEEGAVERVHIAASLLRARYLRTKPLHPTQQVLEETQERIVFGYELILNYELESRLLSFGEEVEVLKPFSLRERVAKRARAIAELYGTPDGGA